MLCLLSSLKPYLLNSLILKFVYATFMHINDVIKHVVKFTQEGTPFHGARMESWRCCHIKGKAVSTATQEIFVESVLLSCIYLTSSRCNKTTYQNLNKSGHSSL